MSKSWQHFNMQGIFVLFLFTKPIKDVFFVAFFRIIVVYCRTSPIRRHTYRRGCLQQLRVWILIAIGICTHTYTYMFSHVNPQRWQLTHSYHLLLLLFLLQPLVLQIIACAVRCQRSHCRLRHFAGSQMETTQSRTNDLMKLKCRYFLVDIYCLRSFHLFLLLFSG